ncbi:MAG: helix-turn-helix domain-containing protein [Synergistaceae bacterium]|jgi:carbohydrate diacid regulator|nr:helix-turn-helix domain-containing protein [Synergistaceae bacterium]
MHEKIAQSIAESASEIIGYGVLVTDENGTIIGCSDVRRVGTKHNPSVEVLRTANPISTSKEEAASLKGVKPGYTCPIKFFNDLVGTVSIAGPPDKVTRFGLLVQKHAEMMLREQNILEMKLRREQAIRDLAQSILLYDKTEDKRGILSYARGLGYDLECCRIAVILEIVSQPEKDEWDFDKILRRIRNFFTERKHLISVVENFQIVLYLALSCPSDTGEMETTAARLSQSLLEDLENHGIVALAGVGLEAHDFNELSRSARAARMALHTGKLLEGSPNAFDGAQLDTAAKRVHSARELVLEILLMTLPKEQVPNHIEQILATLRNGDADGELARTFLVWCRNPFASGEVAQELTIHRNTLQYRLKKIKEIIGLNPWDFHDSFLLWTALTLQQVGQEKTD